MRTALADLSDARVRALIALHQSNMLQSSPPGTSFALDLSGLSRPDMTVWAAWDGEVLAGIGALKRLAPEHGEIKSMRTAASHLRRGIATLLLDTIISHAKSVGISRLSLETGSGPAFDAALAFYRRHGFSTGPAFANYRITEFNQCLHREL